MKKEKIVSEKKYRYNGLMPADGSVAFTIGFIGSLLVGFVLSAIIKDANVLSIVYSVLTQTLFVVAAVSFANKAFRRDCPDIKKDAFPNVFYALGFTKRTNAAMLLLCVVMPIFAILAFLPVSALVEYVFGLLGFHQTPSYADYTSSVGMFLICSLVLCVLPAFGEEMLLRGAFARGLRAKGTVFAIVISALTFGLMHGSPVQFIHQFLIGLVMAYIVILTDCIWHSVIFHFVNNFAVILYEFIYAKSGATYVIPVWAYSIMFVVGIVGLGLLLVLFTKTSVDRSKKSSGEKSVGIKDGERENAEKPLRKKITLKYFFDSSEYKYKSYDKTPSIALYVAIAVVSVIWILNTILGWIQ